MPQDLTVPGWYNDNHYISEKVDECNTIKFGAIEGEEFTPWTAESVRDFLAGFNQQASYESWMGYDNFVASGKAENCSPNPLFNVMQYVAAKANQLNSINYDGRNADNNPWTAQNVLDYFKAHNISAWDHFTTSGQFENVNPSNAMDLSEFLVNKAKQCNDMEYAGKNDWDADSVLAYYQEHGLNAVMVAGSESDPNVVAVPEADQVTAPIGITPWGVATTPVDVELTTGVDVMPENAAPINYIGTVANSTIKSTLNQNDQINGGNDADILTVNMDNFWTGFGRDGYVKNVPTIDLNNETANRDLFFNADKIEGATTYNVDGNISLSNLGQAGITVNLANVDTPSNINIGFTKEAVKGTSDSLTMGVNNVRLPYQDLEDGYLKYKAVRITSNDVENVTVNSTGDVENRIDLTNMLEVRTLSTSGDANLRITGVDNTVSSVDGSASTGNININVTKADLITSATLGSGDDTLTVSNIQANAAISGNEGNDNLVLDGTAGALQLQMDTVETMTVKAGPSQLQGITLDGGATTGLETLALMGNGNGSWQDYPGGGQQFVGASRDISLSNYNEGQLAVQVGSTNNVDLTINDVPDVSVNIGDGDMDTEDVLVGDITLTDAQNVSLNATETNTKGDSAVFAGTLNAGKANNLSLSTAQYTSLNINGGDLSDVSQLTVNGYSDVSLAPTVALANDASSVYVNAQGLVGGKFTTSFTGNHSGDNGGSLASLNFTGSTTGISDVTVDGTYGRVVINTGAANDILNLTGTAPYTQQTLAGSLGAGENTVNVAGTKAQLAGSNFSALQGNNNYIFSDLTNTEVQDMLALGAANGGMTFGDNFTGTATGIKMPTDVPNQNVADITYPAANAGDVTYIGDANGKDVEISGGVQTAAGEIPGGVTIAFGDNPATQVKATGAAGIEVTGGSRENSFTGTATGVNGDFIINDKAGTAGDTINLTAIGATGKVAVTGPEAGMTGKFTTKGITAGNGVVIDTMGANESEIGIDAVTAGDIAITAEGEGADVVNLAALAPTTTGQTLTITLNDDTTDIVNVASDANLSSWNPTITGAKIVLAGNANLGDLSGITDSTISGEGTLQLSGVVDLTTENAPEITSGVKIDDGATVKIGSGFGASSIAAGTERTGKLEIAGGTNEDPAVLTGSIPVMVQVDNGKFVSTANLANFTKGIEGQEGATKDNAGTVIVSATSNAAPISDLNVQVASGAILSVKGSEFGTEGNFDPFALSGEGALKITTDDATLTSSTPVIGTDKLTIDTSRTLSVAAKDFATAITSDAIDGAGTLKFLSDGTADIFATGDDATTFGSTLKIAVDTGATVNIGDVATLKTWVDATTPNAISGAGTVQFADDADLSGFTNLPIDNTATLSTAGGTITFGANIGATPAFKLAGANNLIVDLDTGTDANTTTNLSGIVVTGFTGKVEVSLDGKDNVTLTSKNDIITFNTTSDTVTNGSKVSSFTAADDRIALAGDLDGFKYKAAISTVVTDTPGSIGDELSNYTKLEGNTIYNLTENTVTADTATNIAKYFTAVADGKATGTTETGVLYLAADTNVVLAIKGADATTTNLWLVQNDNDAAVTSAEITLIGVVGGLAVADASGTIFTGGSTDANA